MSVIYRTSDRIKIKVDSLTLTVSPLSYEQKCRIQAEVAKGDLTSAMNGAKLAIKYSLKSIEGVKDWQGNSYSVMLDESGYLQDECIDDLFNLEEVPKVTGVCLSLLSGIPQEFVDPGTGKKLKGVSIIKEPELSKK